MDDSCYKSVFNSLNNRRSAFSPYRSSTVLTNLQRGNIQTQTTNEPVARSIHQLSALGELFLTTLDSNNVNEVDEYGLTPILWAATYGQMTSIKKLIECGANVKFHGPMGETALMFAASHGHSHMVKSLLQQGLDVNQFDHEGNTALMYAAFKDHLHCAKELLDFGADVTLENCYLDTAYQIAVKTKSKQVQSLLESHFLKTLFT